MLSIDKEAKVSPLADIEQSVRGTDIVIGKGVVIDSFVKIKPAGGMGSLRIGEDTVVNSGTVFYTGNGIEIGRWVAIAANCTFAPVNHAFREKDRRIRDQGFLESRGGIVIGDDVWIGANTVILDGSRIGTGCVIGACSLVREELDDYGVYAGNPLRKVGERT